MDGANLLQLTKTRLNNLKRRGTSLKQLCSQYVEINFGVISYSSVTLPFELRNDLLERLCKQQRRDQESLDVKLFEERKKFFEYLLNKYTKKLDLSGILSFCPENIFIESLTEMIRAIAENAPNIEELTIGSFTDNSKSGAYYRNEAEDDRVTFASETLEIELSRLSKLKSLKLKTLIIREFIRLAWLCSNLPDLQVLYARVYQKGEGLIGDAYLDRCFPSLLCYYILVSPTVKPLIQPFNQLKKICSSNTEALKNWYLSKTRISCSENTRHTFCTGSPGRFCKVLMEVDNSGRHEEKVQIQRVDDLADKYFMDDFKFMNEVMVHASTASLESISVSSFRYICFTNEDYSNVLAQLENIGKELHTLMIESIEGPMVAMDHIHLARTFELCPKLEKLMFHNIIAHVDDQQSSLEPFTRLRELRFSWLACSNGSTLMTQILSAPNLEKLSLNVDVRSFKAGGLKQLTSLITGGKILRKLQSLEICLRFVVFRFPVFDFLELGELLKAASAHLPYLSDFRCFIRIYEMNKPCVIIQIGRKEQADHFLQNNSQKCDISEHDSLTSILNLFDSYKLPEFCRLY